ncbi:MAG: hypothetical protein R6X02_02435 [Enhygromyxa sp.]
MRWREPQSRAAKNENNMNKTKSFVRIDSGFVDYPFSTLLNVPPPDADVDPWHLGAVSPAVGQLVITTPTGARLDPSTEDLLVPAMKLRNRPFVDNYPLWQGTTSDLAPFYDEYTISGPTAFLIAPNEVVTAFHSIVEVDIQRTFFVFGRHSQSAFAAAVPGQTHIRVPAGHFARVEAIINRGRDGTTSGNDWARLRLDRELRDITPIRPAHADEVSALEAGQVRNLRVLSHPLGLPLKFARADDLGQPPGPCSGPHQVLVDIGTGSSGAPLLLVREDGTHVLVGVVNGGKVGFTERNLVRTPTGLTLDPAAVFDDAPQYVTPLCKTDISATAVAGA